MNKRILPPLPRGDHGPAQPGRAGGREKHTLLVGLAALLAVLLLASNATAQTSTNYDLHWYVLAGGGERAASASFALNGTLGQWAIGPSADTDYGMHSGYWQSWLDQFTYLPLVLRDHS